MGVIAIAQYTIRDASDITVSAVAPTQPVVDQLWLDVSVSPNQIKRWNGTEWEIVNEYEVGAGNLLWSTSDAVQTITDTLVFEPVINFSKYDAKYATFRVNMDIVSGEWEPQIQIVAPGSVLGVTTRLGSQSTTLGDVASVSEVIVGPQPEEDGWTTMVVKLPNRISDGEGGYEDCCITAALVKTSETGELRYHSPQLETGNQATQWKQSDRDIQILLLGLQQINASLQSQIDSKIETFRQDTQPIWPSAYNESHNGDLWYCTANIGTAFRKGMTYVYNAAMDTWDSYSAADELFDLIDGKRNIYYGKPEDSFNGVTQNDYLVDSSTGNTYRYVNGAWQKVTDYNTAVDDAIEDLTFGGENLFNDTSTEEETVYGTGETILGTYYKTNSPTDMVTLRAFIAIDERDSEKWRLALRKIVTVTDENTGEEISSTASIVGSVLVEYGNQWPCLTVSVEENVTLEAVLQPSSNPQYSARYCCVKLEYGNKPTSWSTSEGDTSEAIRGAMFRISEAEGSIKSLATEIQTGLGAMQTEIEQTSTNIQASVTDLRNQVETTMILDTAGLHLKQPPPEYGQIGYEALLTSESLAFVEVGNPQNKAAEFGKDGAWADRLRSKEQLSVGTDTDGWFDFVMKDDGMAEKWRSVPGYKYPLKILKQPISTTGYYDATLSVEISPSIEQLPQGDDVLKWQRAPLGTEDWENITGSTRRLTYTVDLTAAENVLYKYRCVISDGVNTVTSNEATVNSRQGAVIVTCTLTQYDLSFGTYNGQTYPPFSGKFYKYNANTASWEVASTNTTGNRISVNSLEQGTTYYVVTQQTAPQGSTVGYCVAASYHYEQE